MKPFCYCEDIDNVGVAGRYFWSLYKALSSMILLENTVTNSVTHYCDQTTGWCVAESWIQLITYYIGAVFYSLLKMMGCEWLQRTRIDLLFVISRSHQCWALARKC